MQKFIKYQSLGNDFILLDWQSRPSREIDKDIYSPKWPIWVKQICNRHFGIGADGVLIIGPHKKSPHLLIFNADGTNGNVCINGLRGAANYIMSKKQSDSVMILMGKNKVQCWKNAEKIRTKMGGTKLVGKKSIETAIGDFSGYVTDVGNPHFLIFDSSSKEWLEKNGAFIEKHHFFPQGTNVHFITANGLDYQMLSYERGCGITLACSSGCIALITILINMGKISTEEKITITMLGGSLQGWSDKERNVFLETTSSKVFEGSTLPFSSHEP